MTLAAQSYVEEAKRFTDEIAQAKPDLALLSRVVDVVENVRAILPGLVGEVERLTAENGEYETHIAQVIGDRVSSALVQVGAQHVRIAAMEQILDSNIRTAHVSSPGSVCFCWRCLVNRTVEKSQPHAEEPPDVPSLRVGVTGSMHPIGDKHCRKCSHPHPFVHEGCGGLVHASYGEEMPGGETWLYTICDKCGGPA